MKHFVLTETRTYHFTASSFYKAVAMSTLPGAMSGARQEVERSIVCEETGEEETL